MGVPATTGVLRTDVQSMEIGDYIACKYIASSGAVGTFSSFGGTVGTEIPVGGSTAPNGYFYFIKADKGLLIADRVIQHSISWDTLNNAGLIEGSRIFMSLSTPSDLTVGVSSSGNLAISNNDYIAMGTGSSPYLLIFKKNGENFVRATVNTSPSNSTFGISFSPDGDYLAVGTQGNPSILIYKRNGDTFTKLANPAEYPGGYSYKPSFSPDGNYLAVPCQYSPYVYIYKRNGDTFTKLANPDVLPTGMGYHSTFSSDGIYLAISHDGSPYLTIYKRNGDTFTKLANPATLPTAYMVGISFSPNGNYLAGTSGDSPYVYIYKRNGDTFTKITAPSDIPWGSNNIAFSPDGNILVIRHGHPQYGPYTSFYYRINDTFIRINNPSDSSSIPNGGSIAFSPDGSYLIVGSQNSSPYMYRYRIPQELFRSPSGGVSFIDSNGNLVTSAPTTPLGAFPKNNEWDTYIKNSTLNGKITAGDENVWNALYNAHPLTWCRETSYIGVTFNNGQTGANGSRITRPYNTNQQISCIASSTANATYGFRPVIEYIDTSININNRPSTLWY